jgi:hypothetical protein
MLHEHYVIHSVRYYPRFHVTAVGLGTYYPGAQLYKRLSAALVKEPTIVFDWPPLGCHSYGSGFLTEQFKHLRGKEK